MVRRNVDLANYSALLDPLPSHSECSSIGYCPSPPLALGNNLLLAVMPFVLSFPKPGKHSRLGCFCVTFLLCSRCMWSQLWTQQFYPPHNNPICCTWFCCMLHECKACLFGNHIYYGCQIPSIMSKRLVTPSFRSLIAVFAVFGEYPLIVRVPPTHGNPLLLSVF